MAFNNYNPNNGSGNYNNHNSNQNNYFYNHQNNFNRHYAKPKGHASCAHTMCDIALRTDPTRALGFVCATIELFEKHYGRDHPKELREMALDALNKYGAGTLHQRDPRVLPIYRIVSQLSKSMSPTLMYDQLYEKDLFPTCSQFYIDWANAHLDAGDLAKAMQIANHACTVLLLFDEPMRKCYLHVHKLVEERNLTEQIFPCEPLAPPAAERAVAPLELELTEEQLCEQQQMMRHFAPQFPVPGSVLPYAPHPDDVPEFDPHVPPPPFYPQESADWQVPPRQYDQPAALRPTLAPIQPPIRDAPPAAVAAHVAAQATPANDEDNFPSLLAASLDAPSKKKKRYQPPRKPSPPLLASDDSDKENVQPQPQQPQQRPPAFILPVARAAPVVLPAHIAESAPFSPDMISPSLAAMKPGREDNFIKPSSTVYGYFENGPSGPGDAL